MSLPEPVSLTASLMASRTASLTASLVWFVAVVVWVAAAALLVPLALFTMQTNKK